MNRKLFSRIQTYSISLLLVSFAYNGSFAAPPDAQIERLQTLSEQFDKRFKAERAQALEFAANKGLMLRRILDKGRVLELQRILPGVGPLFYTTNNLGAADTVSTDDVWPGGLAGTNLEGAGLIVGEWDGGAVHPLHGNGWGYRSQWPFNSCGRNIAQRRVLSACTWHGPGSNPERLGLE
jgi:hypothetical protein